MRDFEDKLAQWIIDKRWWLILTASLLACVTITGLAFVSIDSDLRVFFGKDDPRLLELTR